MRFKDIKNSLLKEDKRFREEYLKKDRALELGHLVIEERVRAGITQKKLAELVDTQQPSIARIENGSVVPSISMLDKVMGALKSELVITTQLKNQRETMTFEHETPIISSYYGLSGDFYGNSRNFSGNVRLKQEQK